MPKKLDYLTHLAREHGWRIDEIELGPIPGVSETQARSFTRKFDQHIDFAFVVAFGFMRDTQRWRQLVMEDRYPATGVLFYDEEIVQEYYWKAVRHIERWLKDPDNLLEKGIDMPSRLEMRLGAAIRASGL